VRRIPALSALSAVVAAGACVTACGGAPTSAGRPAGPPQGADQTTQNGSGATSSTSTSHAPAGTRATNAPGGSGSPAAGDASLTAARPADRSYRISVPHGWQYHNGTIPSDHTTDIWNDPSASGESVTVVNSSCTGCVATSINDPSPDPSLLVPAGATSTTAVSPWILDYQTTAAATGLVDYGRIKILHSGGRITGYAHLDVVLPAAQASVAMDIINSYRQAGR
jgi:hypothetical protein